jgi:hypothetical protein
MVTAALTSHADFVFGESLPSTVEWIIGDALRANTEDAWHDAGERLRGIDRLIGSLRHAAGTDTFVHAAIAMVNKMRLCADMEHDPEKRAFWEAMKADLPEAVRN